MTVAESDSATLGWIDRFQRRLSELGWVEPRNISFIPRWAAGNPERIRAKVREAEAALSGRPRRDFTISVYVNVAVNDDLVLKICHPPGFRLRRSGEDAAK